VKRTRKSLWTGSATLVLAGVLLFTSSVALSAELVIALDLTRSSTLVFDSYVNAITDVLSGLQPETCVMIIGVTERSYSRPFIIMERSCIPKAQSLLDSRPKDKKKAVVAEWNLKSKTLKADRERSDVIGAGCLAGSYFSNADQNTPDRWMLYYSDMRHNTHGINLSGVEMVRTGTVMKVVRDKGLLAHLKGVKVWCLGVHTTDKEQQYVDSLKSFWAEYFKNCGATLHTFSPQTKWTAGSVSKN